MAVAMEAMKHEELSYAQSYYAQGSPTLDVLTIYIHQVHYLPLLFNRPTFVQEFFQDAWSARSALYF